MGYSGDQLPELPTPPAGVPVRLKAHASGAAWINQAGRDLHLHYRDGVRGARRVEAGVEVGECPYPGLASFGRTCPIVRPARDVSTVRRGSGRTVVGLRIGQLGCDGGTWVNPTSRTNTPAAQCEVLSLVMVCVVVGAVAAW
jgi:hypothetical protein